jgi:formylglycine-generating enzyme required for sulfatase activity
MADVFLSYKREDQTRIRPLVWLLEREGLSVWWDTRLVPGERFTQVIQREVERSRCVVVAWSANSINAGWVQDEAAAGRDRGILVPLSLDGIPPPFGFRGLQTPDLTGWTGDGNDPRIRTLIDAAVRLVRDPADAAHEVYTEPEPAPLPEPEGPRGLSRRRLLQAAATLGAAGFVSVGGLVISKLIPTGEPLPPVQTEKFTLRTVNDRGEDNPPQPESVEVFAVPLGATSLEFSVIPGGLFQIGSPDSEPQRRANEGPPRLVKLRSFAIGRTAVTQAQWAALVEAEPSPIMQSLPAHPSTFLGDDLPVETVSADQATEFCERLSTATGRRIRLPGEAEWEYACRAGTNTAFHFGPTVRTDLANYNGAGGALGITDRDRDIPIDTQTYNDVTYTSGAYAGGPVGVFRGSTVSVRSFPPNRFGLYEMHGNVWEHCADTGPPVDYRELPADGRPYIGTQSERVLRGGSWSHNPAICRSAYRDSMASDYGGWPGRVGLRVVCELDEAGSA